MKVFSFSLVLLFFIQQVVAQQTGKIDYPYLGVSFQVPAGWQGQEGDGVFLMGHQSIPGLLLISSVEAASLQQMQQEAQSGFVEPASGTNLQLASTIESIGQNAIGGEFAGTLENQQAKAYIIGVFNTSGGESATIMAVTLANMYDARHKSAAMEVYKSFRFYPPVVPPVVNEWKERLSGVRLTYMDTYTSIDYSNPNYTTGGGYSKEEKIDLCPNGAFNYNDNCNVSVDYPNVGGYRDSKKGGAGTWKVVANASGLPVLQLTFHTGEVWTYELTREGDKTFLNGNRYFRTWTGENAPNCN